MIPNPELVRIFTKRGGKTDEGTIRKRNGEKSAALLAEFLDAEGVPEHLKDELVTKIKIEIARATRPPWLGRLERGGDLATLSAPLYLKRVHAEDIKPDGTVENDIIREIDPDLMKAVEYYLSKRRARGLDAGDAAGLRFVLTRPPRAKSYLKAVLAPQG